MARWALTADPAAADSRNARAAGAPPGRDALGLPSRCFGAPVSPAEVAAVVVGRGGLEQLSATTKRVNAMHSLPNPKK